MGNLNSSNFYEKYPETSASSSCIHQCHQQPQTLDILPARSIFQKLVRNLDERGGAFRRKEPTGSARETPVSMPENRRSTERIR
mmetsp:Transcript_23395/g.56489  ORF Transcript_23395/g.56489 Transcript_23395/m.56489 type:complete len:84 (-) Transcript_23395:124-375(-)